MSSNHQRQPPTSGRPDIPDRTQTTSAPSQPSAPSPYRFRPPPTPPPAYETLTPRRPTRPSAPSGPGVPLAALRPDLVPPRKFGPMSALRHAQSKSNKNRVEHQPRPKTGDADQGGGGSGPSDPDPDGIGPSRPRKIRSQLHLTTSRRTSIRTEAYGQGPSLLPCDDDGPSTPPGESPAGYRTLAGTARGPCSSRTTARSVRFGSPIEAAQFYPALRKGKGKGTETCRDNSTRTASGSSGDGRAQEDYGFIFDLSKETSPLPPASTDWAWCAADFPNPTINPFEDMWFSSPSRNTHTPAHAILTHDVQAEYAEYGVFDHSGTRNPSQVLPVVPATPGFLPNSSSQYSSLVSPSPVRPRIKAPTWVTQTPPSSSLPVTPGLSQAVDPFIASSSQAGPSTQVTDSQGLPDSQSPRGRRSSKGKQKAARSSKFVVSPSPSPRVQRFLNLDPLVDTRDCTPLDKDQIDEIEATPVKLSPSASLSSSSTAEIEVGKPVLQSDVATLTPSSSRNGTGFVMPISSEGGIEDAFKRIVKAADMFPSMRGATIMLHSPKRKVVERTREQRQADMATREACISMADGLREGVRGNLIAHAVHTTNLASQDGKVHRESLKSLRRELRAAERLKISVLVFHMGSTGITDYDEQEAAMSKLAETVRELLEEFEHVVLAIETMTCRCVGETSGDLDTLKTFLEKVDMPSRLKVCIDLCHAHVQAHDLSEPQGVEDFLHAVERLGRENIAAVHVSDSYHKHGSQKDGHANVGFGVMGLEAFRKILNHPAFLDKPLILETPRHFPGNRDLGHGLPAEIGRKEDIRLGVEMDFLRTIVDLPQDEWQEKRQALWEQFRKDKRRPENLINNLMNRNRETALYDQFKDERKAMNPLIQSAGQIRRRQREEEDAGEQGREKRPYLQQSATKKGRVDGVSSRVSRRGEKSKCLRKLSRQGDEGQHTTDERDLGSSGRSTRAAAKAAATAITNSWLLTDLTRTPDPEQQFLDAPPDSSPTPMPKIRPRRSLSKLQLHSKLTPRNDLRSPSLEGASWKPAPSTQHWWNASEDKYDSSGDGPSRSPGAFFAGDDSDLEVDQKAFLVSPAKTDDSLTSWSSERKRMEASKTKRKSKVFVEIPSKRRRL